MDKADNERILDLVRTSKEAIDEYLREEPLHHWDVIDYVREEVWRQGHDVETLDGIERVCWMLNAWRYAMRMQAPLTVNQIIRIGQRIEPQKNQTGLRTVGVRVGNRICPPAENVRALLFGLVELHRNHGMTPMEFYRQLLEIHPFVDGNGRTGKVVLNWLNGTLLEPIFPPKDFWGYPIRNP